MLGKKNLIQHKMVGIWTFENMVQFWSLKSPYLFIGSSFSYFFKNIHIYFSNMYHILGPYNKFCDEMIMKNAFECPSKF
jgi:hypothetical protein